MFGFKKKILPYWMTPTIVPLIVVAVVGILVTFPPDWDWLGIGKKGRSITSLSRSTINSFSGTETFSASFQEYWSSLNLVVRHT